MIADDWIDIEIDKEVENNWKRFTNKLKIKKIKPKPKGLQTLLNLHESRYISPPHPYNLRRLEKRNSYEK